MTYKIAPFPMTLSDLQGHLPTARHFNSDLSYICATFDKISIDMARLLCNSWACIIHRLRRMPRGNNWFAVLQLQFCERIQHSPRNSVKYLQPVKKPI